MPDKEVEIQDRMIKMRVRSFVAFCGGLVVITNSFTIGYGRLDQIEKNRLYQTERTDKITKRTLEQAKDYYDRKILEEKLELCQQQRDETNRERL